MEELVKFLQKELQNFEWEINNKYEIYGFSKNRIIDIQIKEAFLNEADYELFNISIAISPFEEDIKINPLIIQSNEFYPMYDLPYGINSLLTTLFKLTANQIIPSILNTLIK